MKRIFYALSCIFLATSCTWVNSREHLRASQPIWIVDVGQPGDDLARCVDDALRGPDETSFQRVGDTIYVTHFPFYRGKEDYEVAFTKMGPAVRVAFRHHYGGTARMVELGPKLSKDAQKVYALVAGCSDDPASITMVAWRDDVDPGAAAPPRQTG